MPVYLHPNEYPTYHMRNVLNLSGMLDGTLSCKLETLKYFFEFSYMKPEMCAENCIIAFLVKQDTDKIILLLNYYYLFDKISIIIHVSFDYISELKFEYDQTLIDLKELNKTPDKKGWYLIHYACLYQKDDWIEKIIKSDKAVKITINEKFSPLMLYINRESNVNNKIIMLLLKCY